MILHNIAEERRQREFDGPGTEPEDADNQGNNQEVEVISDGKRFRDHIVMTYF